MKIVFASAVAITLANPAYAQTELEEGFIGALRGCEEWILNPSSWSEGTERFVATVGLGAKMGLVANVDEVNLPPPELRRANHYWRINSTPEAGYVLIVSDRLPMCHITAGGNSDFQPIAETVLASDDFKARWKMLKDVSREEIASTQFQHREDRAFSIQISRAKQPNERLDRVRIVATATYTPND